MNRIEGMLYFPDRLMLLNDNQDDILSLIIVEIAVGLFDLK